MMNRIFSFMNKRQTAVLAIAVAAMSLYSFFVMLDAFARVD